MGMKLVRITDLLGQDVKGLKADVRSRDEAGKLHYSGDGPLKTMIAVKHRKEKGTVWIEWHWEKGDHYDCGFSGLTRGWEEKCQVFILIEERGG